MPQDFPTTGMPPMIGKMLSIHEWLSYVAAYAFTNLKATKVVLHHTWRPTVAQWSGLKTMQGMQNYYAGKGWTSAPHIYVGPDGIWLFTPLRDIGIHANAGNGSRAAGWYSIGVEMVGDYDHVRPSGAIWEATKAVLGGLSRKLGIAPRQLLSFHRDYNNTKSCPGWAITKEWVFAEVDGWMADHPHVPLYAADSPLVGDAHDAHDAYVAAWQRRCPPICYDVSDIHLIASQYWLQSVAVGLDPWLVAAQCLHETARLTSWWCARPRRNPAGIGVTGQTRIGTARDSMPPTWAYDEAERLWRHGLSFSAWVTHSIPAHLGRLLAYALDDRAIAPFPHGHEPTLYHDQRRAIATALQYRPLPDHVRGSAPTLKQLGAAHNPTGQGWADPGADYGARLAVIANQLRGAS